MKRRKAIGRMILIGGGTVAAYSGYRWYDLTKSPDLAYVVKSKPLIASLAEFIIPATDSPGAKEAKVEDYIILMVREGIDVQSQNRFVDGLRELEHLSDSRYHKSFPQCTDTEKTAVLNYFQEKSRIKGLVGKVQDKFLGRSFFGTLKHFTVEGYCTSQLGATQGLRYILIPGRYEGCIPMQAGQKSWATN